MNTNRIMKKLQKAILCTGLLIKINTYQFYSSDQNRMINRYEIVTPVYKPTTAGNWKDVDYSILATCSVVEVINCLNDIYKAMKDYRSA